MSVELKSIVFTDMYVSASAAWLSGVPGTLDPTPAPPEFSAEIRDLRTMCEDLLRKHGRDDFSLRHWDTAYRASVIKSIDGLIFVLRRFPESIPPIQKLGIHQVLVDRMLKPGLSGLIVVSGAFGQGKTTTSSSIVAGRLSKLGGVAVTIEDPPEMPLHGKHGEGVCFQTWVERGGFADACRKATRWAPSMILLGEVRDAETAVEALRAAVNGRLVICTTHAENPIMAIERIYALATSAGSAGSSEDVAALLASGLTAVIHQRFASQGDEKRLFVDALWVDGEDATSIRATITQRKFVQLGTVLEMQKNRMLAGNPIVRR
jgi:twitching motility protein PilT